MSDSVQPHRRQPIRLPSPRDSPGKNTGVGCHFLLRYMKWSRSVVSNSLRSHGLQPTRLLHPWDFPGKSTGVGWNNLLAWLNCITCECRVSPFQRQSVFTDEQGESTSGFCFQISDEKILLCIAVEFSLEFYQTYCKENDKFEIYLSSFTSALF